MFEEIIAHRFYSAALATGVTALVAAIIAAIWRRSFMWFIGMVIFVVIVTIPLQIFTKQLVRPGAGIGANLDSYDRFLWGNALPCAIILCLSIYVVFLASREYQWAKIEAIAMAEQERAEGGETRG